MRRDRAALSQAPAEFTVPLTEEGISTEAIGQEYWLKWKYISGDRSPKLEKVLIDFATSLHIIPKHIQFCSVQFSCKCVKRENSRVVKDS